MDTSCNGVLGSLFRNHGTVSSVDKGKVLTDTQRGHVIVRTEDKTQRLVRIDAHRNQFEHVQRVRIQVVLRRVFPRLLESTEVGSRLVQDCPATAATLLVTVIQHGLNGKLIGGIAVRFQNIGNHDSGHILGLFLASEHIVRVECSVSDVGIHSEHCSVTGQDGILEVVAFLRVDENTRRFALAATGVNQHPLEEQAHQQHGLSGTGFTDDQNARSGILILHGGSAHVNGLPVRFGQSDQCSSIITGLGETTHAATSHAGRRPVNLIRCHTHRRTRLHAFERHQLFVGRGQIRELEILDVLQRVHGNLSVTCHTGGDTQIDDARRHFGRIVNGLLIVQTIFQIGHIGGSLTAMLITFLDVLVNRAGVTANRVSRHLAGFDLAANGRSDGVRATRRSDFHQFRNPQVGRVGDVRLCELGCSGEADGRRILAVDVPLVAIDSLIV